ncbi:MAG: helix-turn-helix domain-containing protein [Haloarculaceae archaeon]
MSVYAEFRLPLREHPFGIALRASPSVTVEIEQTVPTGGSTYYVWVSGPERAGFLEELQASMSLSDLIVVDTVSDRSLVRFEADGLLTPITEAAAEADATVVALRGDGDSWTYRLRFGDGEALTTFYRTCRNQGLPVELRRLLDPDDLSEVPEYGITDKQRETLTAAFDAGYFEVPREATLADLAARLGVSEQAVSERLRRGLSSLLTSAFTDESTADGSDHDE